MAQLSAMPYRPRTGGRVAGGYLVLRTPKALDRAMRRANMGPTDLTRYLVAKAGPTCTRQYVSAMLHGTRTIVGADLARAIESALQAKPGHLFKPAPVAPVPPSPPAAPAEPEPAPVVRIVGQPAPSAAMRSRAQRRTQTAQAAAAAKAVRAAMATRAGTT